MRFAREYDQLVIQTLIVHHYLQYPSYLRVLNSRNEEKTLLEVTFLAFCFFNSTIFTIFANVFIEREYKDIFAQIVFRISTSQNEFNEQRLIPVWSYAYSVDFIHKELGSC